MRRLPLRTGMSKRLALVYDGHLDPVVEGDGFFAATVSCRRPHPQRRLGDVTGRNVVGREDRAATGQRRNPGAQAGDAFAVVFPGDAVEYMALPSRIGAQGAEGIDALLAPAGHREARHGGEARWKPRRQFAEGGLRDRYVVAHDGCPVAWS